MLVGGFKVKVCRGMKFRAFIEHGDVATARINPHVECVVTASGTCGQAELFRPPGVVFFKP